MRIAFPPSVHRVALDNPQRATADLAEIIGGIRTGRDGVAAELEPLASEAVETAVDGGAFLLAMVAPEGADPAVLTGVALEVPTGWDTDSAAALRDSMEDVGGPDVRETLTIDTSLGPAVLVQRIPGVEQARAREQLTLRLQGFVVDPDVNRMLLLTLAGPSARGWEVHQRLFTELVASACPSAGDAPARQPVPVPDDEPVDPLRFRQ